MPIEEGQKWRTSSKQLTRLKSLQTKIVTPISVLFHDELVNLAQLKSAPINLALLKSAPLKSASVKSAILKFAPLNFASVKIALLKFTPKSFLLPKSVPAKSGLILGFFSRHWFHFLDRKSTRLNSSHLGIS